MTSSDSHRNTSSHEPVIQVTLEQEGIPQVSFQMHERFTIGTDPSCEVRPVDPDVSAVHAEVYPEGERWFIRDLESTGGTFVGQERITVRELTNTTQVLFGSGGVVLTFEVGKPTRRTLTARSRKMFRAMGYVPVGAYKRALSIMRGLITRSQKRRYLKYLVVLGALFVSAAIYAYIKHTEVLKQAAAAQDVFYQMKDLELLIGRLNRRLQDQADSSLRAEAATTWSKLQDLNASYDKYVSKLGIYSEEMDASDKTVYRVARIFGECEIAMPKDFVREVKRYIAEWKKSARLVKAIRRAKTRGYIEGIADALLSENLPPQFFFLALQESELDSSAIGPRTRFGIAKGMWQFIPATAIQYGLRTGPLVDLPRVDPRDDRHKVVRANIAAAKYLRDIYNGEAQASGLLVIASYNWGHNVVRGLVRAMPENPRDRNFWRFLSTYKNKIPTETYNYVFMIFSAAVICENPTLFGFGFEKPLPDSY
jgi:membrane-bound lytic murein transglycosylase D